MDKRLLNGIIKQLETAKAIVIKLHELSDSKDRRVLRDEYDYMDLLLEQLKIIYSNMQSANDYTEKTRLTQLETAMLGIKFTETTPKG